VETTNN